MTGKPPVGPAAQDDIAGFAEAHRRLLADSAIQFDLPRSSRRQPPHWLNGLGNFLSGDHPVLRVLFWAVARRVALLLL